MQMTIFVLPISMLLFFVLFFGIGFILNMLLKMSWIMAMIYPFIAILIIDRVRFSQYFIDALASFNDLINRFSHLAIADILIISSGFIGAIAAGFTIKLLRKKGYYMF
ncbi:YuiB family protein [Bacillus sp. 03113]|uniref:YuiB family protein n=1 Tax=Bacillus sp. 03113 TaxID=2578211 RepID=UPI0011429C55|nr:YuiB family protein [Bacillus sp. 03113]